MCGNRGALTHDAIKLSNGNHAVVRWAKIGAVKDSDTTFEELDADGNVVWELQFPAGIGVYRADRITPPLVEVIE